MHQLWSEWLSFCSKISLLLPFHRIDIGSKTVTISAMKVYENYSLQALNTFGIDVSARYYCTLQKLEELPIVLKWQQTNPDLPVLLIGGGSNMLFINDYPGLVVQIGLFQRIVLEEDEKYAYIRAGAGENWHDFVRWTLAQGYAGLENLSLIPGTVGAAPMQNIGAYGVELKDRFHTLQAADRDTGEMHEFDREACQFGYRDSYFKSIEPGRWLITSVVFRLPLKPEWRIDYAGMRECLADGELTAERISDAIMSIRRSKLPDPVQLGNAGSFFKNPLVSSEQWHALKQAFADIPGWLQSDGQHKLSAGWLIDRCGWKGKRAGSAGTYKRHALVLVNYGGASGEDVWGFAQQIMASVQEKFGVQLEPEPQVIR